MGEWEVLICSTQTLIQSRYFYSHFLLLNKLKLQVFKCRHFFINFFFPSTEACTWQIDSKYIMMELLYPPGFKLYKKPQIFICVNYLLFYS